MLKICLSRAHTVKPWSLVCLACHKRVKWRSRSLNSSADDCAYAAGRGTVFWADTDQLYGDTLAARSWLLCYLWCSSTQSLPVCTCAPDSTRITGGTGELGPL